MSKQESWRTDISYSAYYCDESKLSFAFNEAKERLKSVITANEQLVNKSYIVFGALVSFSTGTNTFAIANIEKLSQSVSASIYT